MAESESKPALRPFEAWAAEKKTAAHVLVAAKSHAQWPAGREVTEEQFDLAVRDCLAFTIR